MKRKAVSGKHAALLSQTENGRANFCIQDWSSKGTVLNGRRLMKQLATLKEGDVLYFGERHFSTRLEITSLRPINACFPPSIIQDEPASPGLKELREEDVGVREQCNTIAQEESSSVQPGSRRSRASLRARGIPQQWSRYASAFRDGIATDNHAYALRVRAAGD